MGREGSFLSKRQEGWRGQGGRRRASGLCGGHSRPARMGRFAGRLCADLSSEPSQATSILSPANLRVGVGDRSRRVAVL